MDGSRFADLTHRLAGRTSRRTALGSALAGMGLGLAGKTTASQSPHTATRAATPEPVTGAWAAVEALARDAEATGGVVGVAVHGAEGELYTHNGHRRFRAASTIKVPIMIEAYRQIERGTLSPDDRYQLRDEDRVPGSGVLANLHTGLDVTIADLLFLMIVVSDNTATNLMIDRLGFDAVNETMSSLGMDDSILGRPMLGRLPAEGDPENWATPSDFALAMQSIAVGQAARPESCERMLETMQHQEEIRRVSRFLPDADDIRWGSKPGDLPGVVNDVGFVMTDNGVLCVAAFCENMPNLDEAERTIGVIAREALSLTGIVSFEPSPPA
jgi:beta-lactamase class A